MPKVTQTAGRTQLGDFAPDFARYNDDILFGEVWSDDTLDLKTRSIITVTSFMGRGLIDSSLRYHLANAKRHGMTKAEIAALITHAGFYTGWPTAWAVFNMAKEVWGDEEETDPEDAMAAHAARMPFPIGDPNPVGQYFVGNSYLAELSSEQEAIFNVTFEPGCRNWWHVHHAEEGGGQILICVAGRGFYQAWGESPVEMTPGVCVNIPAGVRHWHGAAPDSWFSHLAIEVPGTEGSTEWLEAVDDEDYAAACR